MKVLHSLLFTVGVVIVALVGVAIIAAVAGGWDIAIPAVILAMVAIVLSRRA